MLKLLASFLAAAAAVSALSSPPPRHNEALPRLKRANATVPLRIMPLGASVTFGVGSTTGDSYRKDLRDMLVAGGAQVNMVGTQHNGDDFADNQCEAFPGFVIEQIAARANASAPRFLPNLVLLDAGTNNCNRGDGGGDALADAAGQNVTALIGNLLRQSPGATVVLASLLVNKVAAQERCRVGVNARYSALVSDLQGQGAKVLLADMRGPGGLTTADLNDTRHPNDAGYAKMASIWFQAIEEAQDKGLLVSPAPNGIPADGESESSAESAAGMANATASIGESVSGSVGGYFGIPVWAGSLASAVGLFIAS